jgi:uncharacterized SAM-binding protein YcdF (DUF218 family)
MGADTLLLTSLVIAAAILAAMAGRSTRHLAVKLLVCIELGFLLLFWPPAVYVLNRTLESGYRQGYPTDRSVEAIVVLASTVNPPQPERPVLLLGSDTYERCYYAAWLYKHWQPLPIIASGGPDPDLGSSASFADAMRQTLTGIGVPPESVWTEEQSRNTYESAVYMANMLRQRHIRRIALVTEAYHMRRAELAFRRQGVSVVAAPCGFRSRYRMRWINLFPSVVAFNQGLQALHEYLGLLWYALAGRL